MRIRKEEAHDRAAVHAVNAAAFETPMEAELVDVLRERATPNVSLVAEDEDAVIGHILLTPVILDGREDLDLMGLAPMAVVPDRQRQGIGSRLVQAGLAACRERGVGAVVVLGHPDYYPRFGFEPAARFGIRSTWDVPEDVFFVLELVPGSLDGAAGTVRYHVAFDEAGEADS